MFREFVVGQQRRQDEYDRDMTLAWSMAALNNSKKLPPLKTLLSSAVAKTKVKQTPDQMRAQLHIIAEQYGLKVRTRKKGRG